ncbi:hypothetical protein QUF80_21560 [Desulfococcaceae bacterium HSG8]|nr:hypothetical protein [Desulfococcaceae bacterium HSG8]
MKESLELRSGQAARLGLTNPSHVTAAAGLDMWLAESKWWAKPVGSGGSGVVRNLLDQAGILREREGDDLRIRLWLFAHNGVSTPTKTLMSEQGVLWSDRADLDALLKVAGLRKLPIIDE